MSAKFLEAFEQVRAGFSVDRIIADPHLNSGFIAACTRLGVSDAPVETNLALFNRRKGGGLAKTTQRTIVRGQDKYGFAAEMGIRAMVRKHSTTLDRVLCDPGLAAEFDSVAVAIAPGFTSFEYRWAALGLRKASRLKPELLARVVPPDVVGPLRVKTLDPSQVPSKQGLYVLTNRDRVLYVGEAQDLRSRLKKHLDHSDNKHLAHYIWEFGTDDLFVECHVLPEGTPTRVRKAMELELIRSRKTDFNVQR